MPELSLQTAIRDRYREEAGRCCSLSCGNNLAFLGLTPGERVLDLGCGEGEEVLQAALLVGPEGKAAGLDLTPEMVAVAKARAARSGIKNTRFVIGSIEELPFAAGSFDAVISNCVINHAANKTRVYREIYRVLDRSGRFVVSDVVSKHPLPAAVRENPQMWAACLGGAITESEYLDCIRQAGWARLEILAAREYEQEGCQLKSLTIRGCKLRAGS